MDNRKRKILLIGSDAYSGTNGDATISCVSWRKLSATINLRDYDTVIFNLLGMEDGDKDTTDWDIFRSIVTLPIVRDILQNQGKILVIGDPRLTFEAERESSNGKMERGIVEFLDWTGLAFQWHDSAGDTIHFHDSYNNREFVEFVKRLKHFYYSLSKCHLNECKIEEVFNMRHIREQNLELERELITIVENRYRNPLVFETRIRIFQDGYRGREIRMDWGTIMFLPKISATIDETLQIILRDLCGFEAALPEPDWIVNYRAPGQQEVDEDIAKINAEIEIMKERLRSAQLEREKRRSCLKLLFERDFELEPAVRDILRALGAHVEDPVEKNKEDGWITVETLGGVFEGVLEIKSTRSPQFGEDGRKQLLDWIDRGITLREKRYKGIFIGNSSVDKSVDERQPPFSDSWKKAATLNGICGFTTVDLYVIYILHSRGTLDVNAFWKNVFECNGLLPMRGYFEALTPKEKAK